MLSFKDLKKLSFDILVLGGGAAGLRSAVSAKEANPNLEVAVASKFEVGYGSLTFIAEGYFNTLNFEEGDSPKALAEDIWKAGRKICNGQLVKLLAEQAGRLPLTLKRMGVRLQEEGGQPVFRKYPGHSFSRTLHVKGRGAGLSLALKSYAEKLNVTFLGGLYVSSLLVQNGNLVGAIALDRKGNLYLLRCRAAIIALGGGGWVYSRSGCPGGANGDGYSLALKSGLPLVDMEFVQFYPTYAYDRGLRMILVAERLLVAGAIIKNRLGEDILAKRKVDFFKLTRDKLTRIIMEEVLEGYDWEGFLKMDFSHMQRDKIQDYMETLYERGFPKGLKEVYISPAAHFNMGGIPINQKAETGIEGLYAAGEATGGLHGANRLAANALTEALVFGEIAGKEAAKMVEERGFEEPEKDLLEAEISRLEGFLGRKDSVNLSNLFREARETLWRGGGIIRTGETLKETISKLKDTLLSLEEVRVGSFYSLVRLLELESLLWTGLAICTAAFHRKESRGAHFRADYPEEKPQYLKNLYVEREKDRLKVREEKAKPPPYQE